MQNYSFVQTNIVCDTLIIPGIITIRALEVVFNVPFVPMPNYLSVLMFKWILIYLFNTV